MELQFNREPCLILEATELLYVFVNQLSPRMLTADGPYCIPPAEVSAMIEEICGSLSPEEPTLRYYFQKYQLLEQAGDTCLARLMVFSFVNLNESDPDRSFQALCDTWDGAPGRVLFHQLQGSRPQHVRPCRLRRHPLCPRALEAASAPAL